MLSHEVKLYQGRIGFRLTIEMHSLRFPFLSGLPVLSQLSGFRGILRNPPKTLAPSTPVAGSILEKSPGILCFQPRPWPFGLIYHFATRFPGERLIFLQPVTMSLERRTFALSFAVQYRRLMKAHPHLRVIVMANTLPEQDLLTRLGVEARYIPQNMFIDESMYFPVHDAPRTFDAIYNAQLAPFKRHNLARTIPSCAYITKLFSAFSPEHKRASIKEFMRDLPRGHVVLNDITAGDVRLMNHLQVNRALSTAHVGLCLSKVEGAMYASTEYLLAGLPVVSTRSAGGRDAFFHPDTSLIVDDTPRAVQDGVAAMKARHIPPDHVRNVTLDLINKQRDRFNALIDALRGRTAESADFRWSFDYHHKLSEFGPLSEFERKFATRRGPDAVRVESAVPEM